MDALTNIDNHSGQGASKTKEAFPSKQILTVKPRASPPVLVIYVYIYFSGRINIVGSKQCKQKEENTTAKIEDVQDVLIQEKEEENNEH